MTKFDEYLNYFYKCKVYAKKNIMFFNIKNKNVKELAYREYCYKRLEKKYKKFLNTEKKEEHKPEFSNYVWICWFQGIDSAPELVKACINSVKEHMPEKQIIIIDDKNWSEYVDVPEYIKEKRKKGNISEAHFSDILRLKLLNKYGGLWIDATVYITESVQKSFFEQPLFVLKNISLFQKEELSVKASNWLIYSCKRNEILELTEKLLLEYWKKETYAINYNIFHLFFTMACKVYPEEWKKIPSYSNVDAHILQFELLQKFNTKRWNEIKQISKFHKLNHRLYTDNEESYYYYILHGDKNNG